MGTPKLEASRDEAEGDAQILLNMLRVHRERPADANPRWKGPQSYGGYLAKGILDELMRNEKGTYVTIPMPAPHHTNTLRSALAKTIRRLMPGWTCSVYQADGDRLCAVIVRDVEYTRDGGFTPRAQWKEASP